MPVSSERDLPGMGRSIRDKAAVWCGLDRWNGWCLTAGVQLAQMVFYIFMNKTRFALMGGIRLSEVRSGNEPAKDLIK